MAHSDEDEQMSQHESDERKNDEEGEEAEEGAEAQRSGELGDMPVAEPEVEDSFEDEEEVLAPKPFPRTILLTLPDRTAAASSSSSAPRVPTRVHVCLTRGTMDAPHHDEYNDDEEDEEEETAAAVAKGEGEVPSRPGSAAPSTSTSSSVESGVPSAASRMQGCCAAAHTFEADYATRLAALRRRHILRRLHGNSDRQRRFLEQERRAAQRRAPAAPSDDAENDEDGAVAAGGGINAVPGVDATDDPTDPLEGVVWPWTSVQRPPPYWLPALLTNDAPTFQRVLQVMYGWVITPESHPADRLRLTSGGQLLSGPPGKEGGGPAGGHRSEEDDDDVDQADPAHHKPDFFLPSNAFGGGEEEEEGDEMEKSKNRSNVTDRGDDTHGPERPSKSLMNDFNDCDENELLPSAPLDAAATAAAASVPDALPHPASFRRPSRPNNAQAKLSTATAPPPVVALPAFPFTAYELFLAHDTASGEWHLLDTHPLFVMEGCRRLRAAQMEAKGLSETAGGTRVRQNAAPNDEEEDEEDEGEGEEDDNDGGSRGKGVRPSSGAPPPQGQAAGGGEAGELCHVPVYDMTTLIPVSPITLAALFSGSALRCCLLQPLRADANSNSNKNGDDAVREKGSGPKDAMAGRRVPDHAVLRTFDAAWLAEDVAVALPILATICRARQHVLQQDATRIPYPLTPLWLDPRPLFALPGFKDATQRATPADVRQWCVRPDDKAFVDDEGGADGGVQWQLPSRPATAVAVSTVLPHKWDDALDHILPAEHYGRVVLSALLAAEVLPTQALRLNGFTQLDGLRLAVWWWLRLPPTLLLRWGADASAAAAAGEDGGVEEQDEGTGMAEENDEGEDERDGLLDTMRPEEATEVLLQRATVMQQRTEQSQRRRQRAQGPLLLFAPLLQRVLVELQRRLDRAHGEDSQGQPLPPSQFTLQESVARTYAVERLDSGRPRQDPLVTSAFVGAATSSSSSASDGNDVPVGKTAVRHHRLYQSDIVLLALGLTTTPAPPPPRLIAVDVEDTAVGDGDGDVDGHTALFEHLLDAKLLRCVRSPVDRARAGTTKLLLLSAADFCTSASRLCLFTRLPTFELLGNSGYCPLPELVQAWSNAATRCANGPCAQTERTVCDFAHHLWNEMRWRLDKGQYSAAVVTRMAGQLPELFDCVASHTSTYYAILARLQSEADAQAEEQQQRQQLASTTTTTAAMSAPRLPHKASASSTQRANRPQRPSLISGPTLQANRQEALEETYPAMYATQSVSGTAAAAAVNVPLSVAHPNKYSAAVMDAKEHVYALWAAFPVSPLTFWTPETLYVLLFGRPGGVRDRAHAAAATPSSPHHFHAAALRVLLEHGVSTVQPCPLDTLEVPAVEAALDRADVEAVKVLLGLGAASLRDLRRDGSATLESWAETLFSPADMQVLHYVEARNAKAARADPRVQYGARRFEAAAVHI